MDMKEKKLGILMLDTEFLRVPGDVGNERTFPYTVIKKVVKGAKAHLIVRESTPEMLQPFVEAAQELEKEGADIITTSCGFLAMFQKELAAAVSVPVLTSSLLQAGYLAPLLGSQGKIGILTANSRSLTEKHFRGAGIETVPKVIYGMEGTPFERVFVDDDTPFDQDLLCSLVVKKAEEMTAQNPEVSVIVFECTNMPPYAAAVQRAVRRPVYDITTLVDFAMSGICRKEFAADDIR